MHRMLRNTKSRWLALAVGLSIVGLGFYLRTAGLFRGLNDEVLFHPDEAKQVSALFNYLNDRYVWYVGSLFYDGYPLFLNHVDEWLLRPIFGARTWLSEGVGLAPPGVPSRQELFYWSRALRVFYGLLVVLMAWPAARLLGLPRPLAFFCMALSAIAPLSIVVAHFATGDIGVDLFTACIILCTGWYAHRKAHAALFAAGMFTGFAFAAKYQGFLSGGVVFSFLLLETLLTDRHIGRFFRRSLLVLAGLVSGVLIAIPQFFINPERTWRDTWDNFIFIKNYNVPAKFFELPLGERLSMCFANNTPLVLQALGWSVVFAAALACLLTAIALTKTWRARRSPDRVLLFAAVVSFFPFWAVLLSIAGKPQIQAFHFAFLQWPLCLAVGWTLGQFWHASRKPARRLAVALALLTLLELGAGARREHFFWQREELRSVAKTVHTELVDERLIPVRCPQSVRTMQLEDDNLPAFRNSSVKVPVMNGQFWNAAGIAPVPSVPMPGHHEWIFVNGPVFPRNDRMFHVPAGPALEKGLIFPQAPTTLTLAVQSGLWPSEVKLTVGGQQRVERLASYESRIVTLEAPLQAKPLLSNAWHVAVRAQAAVGDAWIALLPDDRDRANYQLWNGTGAAHSLPADETALRHVASAKYLEGTDAAGKLLKSGDALVLSRNAPLAAGIYRLDCEVFPLETNTAVELSVEDLFFGASAVQSLSVTRPSPDKPQVLTRVFQKAFVPCAVDLKLQCVTGMCRIGRWELKPETETLVSELNRSVAAGQRPAWLRTTPIEVPPTAPGPLAGIAFGRAVELIDIQIPPALSAGPTNIHCAMKLSRFPFQHFTEYFAFVHLIDRNDELKAVITIPLWQATACEKNVYPIEYVVPADLPRGDYSLWLGVYNGRTDKRLPISTPHDVPVEDDKVLIGHTTRL